MQQVGQHPLAITAGHQYLRQIEVVQKPTQHRQYPLAAPDQPVLTELHDPAFPHTLVLVQLFQGRQRKIQGDTGQRRLEQALGIRLGTGLEPGQQVLGFLGGEHRVFV
ncbi:hypothetical protein D3C78_523960 [compost metagenome]